MKSAGFSNALGWSLFAPRPAPSGSDMNAMNARHAKRNMPVYRACHMRAASEFWSLNHEVDRKAVVIEYLDT